MEEVEFDSQLVQLCQAADGKRIQIECNNTMCIRNLLRAGLWTSELKVSKESSNK